MQVGSVMRKVKSRTWKKPRYFRLQDDCTTIWYKSKKAGNAQSTCKLSWPGENSILRLTVLCSCVRDSVGKERYLKKSGHERGSDDSVPVTPLVLFLSCWRFRMTRICVMQAIFGKVNVTFFFLKTVYNMWNNTRVPAITCCSCFSFCSWVSVYASSGSVKK